ncbi:MAG TPA: hypothetical protein VHI95_17405, partial [Acidimicrobiales bacterium]|nr:hypothetical protein [Acidimicrobiales bacterium]
MAKLLRDLTVDVHGGVLVAPPKSGSKLPSRADRELLVSTGRGVVRVNVKDGSTEPVIDGLNMPAGLAIGPDGKTLFIADLDPSERHFVLYQQSVTRKPKARGKALLRAAGEPGQLAVSRTTLFFADRIGGKLVAVDLRSGDSQVLAEGLAGPVGVFLAADGKRIYVSERDAGRVVSVPTAGGLPTVELNGLLAPRYLTAGPRAGTVLVTQETGAGGVLSWKLASGEIESLLDLDAGEQPVAAWPIGKRLIVAAASRLRWWDLVAVATLPVQLKVSTTKPFIGEYLRVAVDMGTTGIGFDDLDFSIPDGDAGGLISYARDDESAPNEVMLLVGWQPGMHKLIATDRSTAATVAELEFEITDRWTDSDKSPSRWNVGEMSYFTTGYTWGGGPVGAQNINVLPPGSLRNICIVMVELSDAMYPTGSAFDTARANWADGAVGPAPSARTYYEEVSHGSFTLSLVENPPPRVTLSSAWTDNFEPMSAPWPANSFAPIDGQAFAQACVSAAAALTDSSGNALIDFSDVQSLILVIRSQGTAATDKFFWAQAWGGSFAIPGGTTVPMAVLGMPDDWAATRGGGRTIDETLSHELGHNLGYPDLYTNADPNYSADVISRDITNYDLMSAEGELPHMSIGQKMECGWVAATEVRAFDFSRSTIPLDESVTLVPAEGGPPPTGKFKAIEVRIADGNNYYFEYRRTQSGGVGDQQLSANTDTADRAVLGTFMVTQGFTYPIEQPQIIRLEPDVEGEKSFYASGQDYKETDSTSVMAVADFKMSVLSTGPDEAQVRIQYGTNGRPDLYILPWPGGENWQSPDIEVRNARATMDPAHWFNTPWIGHANTVVARSRNRGPVTCRNVKVDIVVKDYTVGGGPEAFLGSATHDVPPESVTPFVEFEVNWIPPNDGHRCIIARTPLFLDTSVNPTLVELSDSNNMAQSNYTQYIAAAASPARRGIAEVTLNNPFQERALIYVMPQIRGPFAEYY